MGVTGQERQKAQVPVITGKTFRHELRVKPRHLVYFLLVPRIILAQGFRLGDGESTMLRAP